MQSANAAVGIELDMKLCTVYQGLLHVWDWQADFQALAQQKRAASRTKQELHETLEEL